MAMMMMMMMMKRAMMVRTSSHCTLKLLYHLARIGVLVFMVLDLPPRALNSPSHPPHFLFLDNAGIAFPFRVFQRLEQVSSTYPYCTCMATNL